MPYLPLWIMLSIAVPCRFFFFFFFLFFFLLPPASECSKLTYARAGLSQIVLAGLALLGNKLEVWTWLSSSSKWIYISEKNSARAWKKLGFPSWGGLNSGKTEGTSLAPAQVWDKIGWLDTRWHSSCDGVDQTLHTFVKLQNSISRLLFPSEPQQSGIK